MERKKFLLAVAIGLGATISLCVRVPAQISSSPPSVAQQQNVTASAGVQGETENVSDEEALSQDPNERGARLAKNRRFNGGHYDLTRSEDRFIEHYAPRMLPAIPVKESGIIFVGSVLRIQPYLSEDRTHIYTEMTFRVEDMFKYPPSFTRPANGTLVIDRIGGTMRLRSGQVVRDDTDVDIGGKPYVGGRYVVFVKERSEREALDIIKAYELRDGKVFKLAEDGKPGKVLISTTPSKTDDPLSDEQTLLQAVMASNLATRPPCEH